MRSATPEGPHAALTRNVADLREAGHAVIGLPFGFVLAKVEVSAELAHAVLIPKEPECQ